MGDTVRIGGRFEWDENKAAENIRKHKGVTFEEGATVFDDGHALYEFDVEHSRDEDRFKIIGNDKAGRTLVVSYTCREERIRIVSARKAEPSEKKQYANGPQS